MNITLTVEHEWQADMLKNVADFFNEEHPMPGSPNGCLLVLSMYNDHGAAGGLLRFRNEHAETLSLCAAASHVVSMATGFVAQTTIDMGAPEEVAIAVARQTMLDAAYQAKPAPTYEDPADATKAARADLHKRNNQ